MYVALILLIIFAACVAFQVNNGLWTNALMLVNVVTAALIAVNYFEPLARWMGKQGPTFKYLWDFLALWLIFAIALGTLRGLTDLLSRVKVKFKRPVDLVGGIFFACWTAWIVVCFTTMTLHTAPLGRNFLDGSFQETPQTRMFFGLAPDRQWLGFTQKISRGGFSRGNVFDPNSEFILKYGQRRFNFENTPEKAIRTSEPGE